MQIANQMFFHFSFERGFSEIQCVYTAPNFGKIFSFKPSLLSREMRFTGLAKECVCFFKFVFGKADAFLGHDIAFLGYIRYPEKELQARRSHCGRQRGHSSAEPLAYPHLIN